MSNVYSLDAVFHQSSSVSFNLHVDERNNEFSYGPSTFYRLVCQTDSIYLTSDRSIVWTLLTVVIAG